MEGKLNFLFAIIAVILIASVALMTYSCQRPSTPVYFNKHLSLEDAAAQADQNGKVLVALWTADWCEPCAKLKKGALTDSRIVEWMKANAQPAYLDMTKADSGDAEAAALMKRYDVQAFPTLMILKKDREIARLEEVVSARDLLKWLTENSAKKPAPAG
jgi:thiol:disulfide interchange protein